MVGLADLVASVVEEITGAVPRVLGRTQAQFELAQRLVSSLPCPGRSRHGETDAAGAAAEDRVDDGDRPGARTGTAESAPAPAVPDRPLVGPAVASLAIPDYDSLAASQVVPRLASLDASDLAAVGDYERAHRGRQTILNRVRQLQVDAGTT